MIRKGFTLVELLVVVSIIAILAVVIFVAINPVEIQKKTRDATRLQNLGEIHKALGLAMAEATGSAVLTSTGGVATASTGGSRDVDGTGYINVNISKYLATLPVDPKDGAGGTDAAGATITNFQYTYSSDGTAYKLTSFLESIANNPMYANDGGSLAGQYEVFSPGGKNLP